MDSSFCATISPYWHPPAEEAFTELGNFLANTTYSILHKLGDRRGMCSECALNVQNDQSYQLLGCSCYTPSKWHENLIRTESPTSSDQDVFSVGGSPRQYPEGNVKAKLCPWREKVLFFPRFVASILHDKCNHSSNSFPCKNTAFLKEWHYKYENCPSKPTQVLFFFFLLCQGGGGREEGAHCTVLKQFVVTSLKAEISNVDVIMFSLTILFSIFFFFSFFYYNNAFFLI